MSLICKLFGHRYGKHPDSIETKPCDRWDDCDIKTHHFDMMYWTCRTCGFCKTQRFEDGRLVK